MPLPRWTRCVLALWTATQQAFETARLQLESAGVHTGDLVLPPSIDDLPAVDTPAMQAEGRASLLCEFIVHQRAGLARSAQFAGWADADRPALRGQTAAGGGHCASGHAEGSRAAPLKPCQAQGAQAGLQNDRHGKTTARLRLGPRL